MKYNMHSFVRDARKGFTLIEILIVVAIIAILASVVLIGLGPTQQAGRDAKRLSDLREVQTGLELFYSKCGYYPGTASGQACGSNATVSDWLDMSNALINAGIGLTQIPNDPAGGSATYYYTSENGGSSYVLGAKLENANGSAFQGYTWPSSNPVPTGMTSCQQANSEYCLSL